MENKKHYLTQEEDSMCIYEVISNSNYAILTFLCKEEIIDNKIVQKYVSAYANYPDSIRKEYMVKKSLYNIKTGVLLNPPAYDIDITNLKNGYYEVKDDINVLDSRIFMHTTFDTEGNIVGFIYNDFSNYLYVPENGTGYDNYNEIRYHMYLKKLEELMKLNERNSTNNKTLIIKRVD